MKIEENGIYLGDAYELIKQVPDKSVDLIYTDIPYKTDFNKNKSTTFHFEDSYRATDRKLKPIVTSIDYSIVSEFLRVLKKVNIYVWCSVSQISDIIEKTKKYRHDILVWHKTNALRMNKRQYITDLEYCLLITEGQGKNNTGSFHSKLYESASNVSENRKYRHPTCKPEKLVREHLLMSSKPGEVVFDPFMGSGTTCAVAKSIGRKYIGFEIDKDYYETAKQRISEVHDDKETDS